MSKQPDFGLESFRALIEIALRHRYRFVRFDNVSPSRSSQPNFWMRHDVDISPMMALELGRIASDLGVSSNFFFQLNSEAYAFFGRETLDIIAALREMKHCVGLHVDERLIGTEESKIASTLDWLNSCVTPIDRVVSFHRPSPAVLGKQYKRFINAYDPRFFNADRYLSDSRRSMAFYPIMLAWLAAGHKDIQLLIHPEWWRAVASVEEFWTLLSDRRTGQLRRYMLANFNKVFAPVLNDEDRPPRV